MLIGRCGLLTMCVNQRTGTHTKIVPIDAQKVSRKVSPRPIKTERDHGVFAAIPFLYWTYRQSGREDLNLRPLDPQARTIADVESKEVFIEQEFTSNARALQTVAPTRNSSHRFAVQGGAKQYKAVQARALYIVCAPGTYLRWLSVTSLKQGRTANHQVGGKK